MGEPLKIWHMVLGMALMVIGLLSQASSAVWYISKQDSKVNTVIETQKEMKEGIEANQKTAQASLEENQRTVRNSLSTIKSTMALASEVTELRRDVTRIDIDGAKVYLIRRPEEIKAADEMRAQVKSIEAAVNNLNVSVAQVLVLTRQVAAKESR